MTTCTSAISLVIKRIIETFLSKKLTEKRCNKKGKTNSSAKNKCKESCDQEFQKEIFSIKRFHVPMQKFDRNDLPSYQNVAVIIICKKVENKRRHRNPKNEMKGF